MEPKLTHKHKSEDYAAVAIGNGVQLNNILEPSQLYPIRAAVIGKGPF